MEPQGQLTSQPVQGLRVRGRTFTHDELLQVRAIVEASPGDPRVTLSRKVCEILNWRQINGQLKDRSCRDLLAKLDAASFLRLPPSLASPPPRRPITFTPATEPRLLRAFNPRDIDQSSFTIVTRSGRSQERLWNEYVERYHYLRYGVPVGPNIKYFVKLDGDPIACLVFSGAAWKVAPRDNWIGWSTAQREANLRFIVNNTRFLVLPWVRVDNLASRILSLATKRLPHDWHRFYGYRPLLVETFVQAERHPGTCYRAANWLCVGETKGRGKLDRTKARALPRKLVFLWPLLRTAAQHLAAMPSHSASASVNGDP